MRTRRINESEFQDFRKFLREEPQLGPKRLSSNELIQLKAPVFNDYLKKVKHFAKNQVLSTQKPLPPRSSLQSKCLEIKGLSLQKHGLKDKQRSVYFYQSGEIASIKQFVFLAEEAMKEQARKRKVREKEQSKRLIRTVEERVQSSSETQSQKPKVNLRLTLKSAQNIKSKLIDKEGRTFSQQRPSTVRAHKKQNPETQFIRAKSRERLLPHNPRRVDQFSNSLLRAKTQQLKNEFFK